MLLNTPVLGMPDVKFSSLLLPLPPSCHEGVPRIAVSPLMPSESGLIFILFLPLWPCCSSNEEQKHLWV